MQKYKDMDGVKITSYKEDETWKQYKGKDRELMRKYGITEKYYKTLLEVQRFKCATCKTYRHGISGKLLAIDHDHETGQVRGLLCSNCNLALGLVKDNTSTLQAMIIYLEESHKWSES